MHTKTQEFNPLLRYTVEESLQLLKISRATFYANISDGTLKIIKDRGRTFVPGSEIVRHSSLAAAA